jgi:hypothetical protein
VLIAAWGAQSFLLHLTHATAEARRRSRARLVYLVLAVLAVGLLFVLSPVERGTVRFTSDLTVWRGASF